MATTVTSKCPHCGAQIVFEPKSKATMCRYCTSMIAIKEVKGSDVPSLSGFLDNFQLKEIVPKYEYWGRYVQSLETDVTGITGYLCISDEEVIFKPDKFDFLENGLLKSIDDTYIRFDEICGYRYEGIYITPLAQLIGNKSYCHVICTNDGQTQKEHIILISSSLAKERNSIFNNIEYFRKQFFIRNGKDVPELTVGDIHVSGDNIIDTPFSKYISFFNKISARILIVLIPAIILILIIVLLSA